MWYEDKWSSVNTYTSSDFKLMGHIFTFLLFEIITTFCELEFVTKCNKKLRWRRLIYLIEWIKCSTLAFFFSFLLLWNPNFHDFVDGRIWASLKCLLGSLSNLIFRNSVPSITCETYISFVRSSRNCTPQLQWTFLCCTT